MQFDLLCEEISINVNNNKWIFDAMSKIILKDNTQPNSNQPLSPANLVNILQISIPVSFSRNDSFVVQDIIFV